jgi:hypothetical protein
LRPGEKLDPKEPGRRIIFSPLLPICSTDIQSRGFVGFAESTRALFADIQLLQGIFQRLKPRPSRSSFLLTKSKPQAYRAIDSKSQYVSSAKAT